LDRRNLHGGDNAADRVYLVDDLARAHRGSVSKRVPLLLCHQLYHRKNSLNWPEKSWENLSARGITHSIRSIRAGQISTKKPRRALVRHTGAESIDRPRPLGSVGQDLSYLFPAQPQSPVVSVGAGVGREYSAMTREASSGSMFGAGQPAKLLRAETGTFVDARHSGHS
jgi:hypothetical protein